MGRIAIVDDSRLVRTFAAACLRKEGHEVLEIEPNSIFEVMRTMKEAVPDLMIMDFLMPNCPGTSLARACHEDPDLREMKVVMLTAHHDAEVTQRLRNMGVVAVLFKPVEAQVLAETVRDLLAG
jgi:two-component system phosphate regulon response regulator PhoB